MPRAPLKIVSPGHVPLREAKLTEQVEPLPLIDVDHCDGKFCKLKDRVIPTGMQTYDVMLPISPQSSGGIKGGKIPSTHEDQVLVKQKFCRLCMVALNGNERHLFDDNAMMLNGIRP